MYTYANINRSQTKVKSFHDESPSENTQNIVQPVKQIIVNVEQIENPKSRLLYKLKKKIIIGHPFLIVIMCNNVY